tara:strand:- start:1219 stop:1674 length:456 start_codon:yes stop_codon:yes gene_type:complete
MVNSANNIKNLVNKNKKPILAILLVIVTLGVLYLLVVNRKTNEGFQVELPYHQGPVDWNKDKEVLVVFSKMEGCGHCVRFAPEWKKISDKLNGKTMSNGKVCRMVVVDPNHKLSEGVRGFPTIKKYVGSKPGIEFEGPRTADNLERFCKSS